MKVESKFEISMVKFKVENGKLCPIEDGMVSIYISNFPTYLIFIFILLSCFLKYLRVPLLCLSRILI